MPSTQDFEYLLDCANVIGVDYDEDAGRVRVFVSRRVSTDELDEADDVTERIEDADADVDVEVVDAGYDAERDAFDVLSLRAPIPEAAEGREDRHRPVVAGVSEANAESTAATAGPYPARVADPDAATWSDAVEAGDLVRLSNNHVYARSNRADLGEPIVQPSPHDGGALPADEVGELVGYVPVADGGVVDVAARSTDRVREAAGALEVDPSWPTGVRRTDYDELRGETLVSSGRTTGTTSATLEGTGATVRVNFGDEVGTVTMRDQLVTAAMSEPGDSGSPSFLEAGGAFVGLLFAGSPEQTILNKAGNLEAELGVELLVGEPDDEPAGAPPVFTTTFDATVSAALDGPTLSLESITLADPPAAGRELDGTATVLGTERGRYWLAVGDDRRTFELGADHETADGAYRRTVPITISVSEEATGAVDVRLRGGRVE